MIVYDPSVLSSEAKSTWERVRMKGVSLSKLGGWNPLRGLE
jgi:hypothetical protein